MKKYIIVFLLASISIIANAQYHGTIGARVIYKPQDFPFGIGAGYYSCIGKQINQIDLNIEFAFFKNLNTYYEKNRLYNINFSFKYFLFVNKAVNPYINVGLGYYNYNNSMFFHEKNIGGSFSFGTLFDTNKIENLYIDSKFSIEAIHTKQIYNSKNYLEYFSFYVGISYFFKVKNP